MQARCCMSFLRVLPGWQLRSCRCDTEHASVFITAAGIFQHRFFARMANHFQPANLFWLKSVFSYQSLLLPAIGWLCVMHRNSERWQAVSSLILNQGQKVFEPRLNSVFWKIVPAATSMRGC